MKTTTVENGNTVSVHYRGTFDDGTQFDSSYDRGEPLNFEVGSGQMIAGFDAALPGMGLGETKNVTLSPEHAYGERVDEAVQDVPKSQFPEGFEFRVGEYFQATHPSGQPVVALVQSDNGDSVTLDMNHPMAGKQLNFEIEVTAIE